MECDGAGQDSFDRSCAQPDLAAEALFTSDLQPSERPDAQAVAAAVTAMLLCYGSDGCADEVATEFGDHPEAAARRMLWAINRLTCLAADRRTACRLAPGAPASAAGASAQ